MKIKLPHRVLRLTEEDKMLPDEDKVALVNSILQEDVSYRGESISLEDYLSETFDNRTSIVIMDMLSYYITKKHRERQDIMTRETMGKMQKGDGRTANFSNLRYSDRVSMGLVDDDDYSNQY